MRFQTPYRLSRFIYLALDTAARCGDELFAVGVGRLYVGVYPTGRGLDLSVGVLDHNDSL